MKLKIGDKAKAITQSRYYARCVEMFDVMKTETSKPWFFDCFVPINSIGTITNLRENPIGNNLIALIEIGSQSYLFDVEGLEKVEDEGLTFEEVIANIKEGEVYEPVVKGMYSTLKISKDSRDISIIFVDSVGTLVPTMQKYKLIPKTTLRAVLSVQHKVDGKAYRFRSNDRSVGALDFVICNTSVGQTYGRIFDLSFEDLTNEEYNALRTIERG